MPLEFQTVAFPFGQGLNEENAPAVVPAGKLHIAQNAWIEKVGSIRQRPGLAGVSGRVFGVPYWSESRYALELDGTNWVDWTVVGSGVLNFTTAETWTMSLWVRATNAVGTKKIIGRNQLGGPGWALWQTPGDNFLFVRYGTVSNHSITWSAPVTTQWLHVMISVESATVVRVCINGVLTTITTIDPTLAGNMDQAVTGLEVGASNGVPQFQGFIDEVIFFYGTTNEAQANAMYNGGLPGGTNTYPRQSIVRLRFEGNIDDSGLWMHGGVNHGGVYSEWTSTGIVYEADQVLPDKNETLVLTDRHVLTRLHEEDAWRRVDHRYEANIDQVINCERGSDVIRKGEGGFDSCVIGDWCVYAWSDWFGARVYMRFLDLKTGAKTEFARTFVTQLGSSKVRVVAAANYVYVVFANADTEEIQACRWDINNIEAGFEDIVLGTQLASLYEFDICAIDNDELVLCYHWFGLSGDVRIEGTRVVYATLSWAVLGDHIEPFRPDGGGTFVVSHDYGIDADYGPGVPSFFIAYSAFNSTTSEYAIDGFTLDDGMGVLANATELTTRFARAVKFGLVAERYGKRAWVAWEFQNVPGPSDQSTQLRGLWFDLYATPTDGHRTYHLGLLSKPWIHEGVVYAIAHIDEEISSDYEPPPPPEN